MLEFILKYIKYYELNTPMINDIICHSDIKCSGCLVRSQCNNTFSSQSPKYTREIIAILKKDYPELMI